MFASRAALHRRTLKGLLATKDKLSPLKVRNSIKGALQFEPLGSGEGYHKYEIDFLETAEWTVSLLEKMSKNKGKLEAIAAAGKPFEKLDEKPVCVIATDYYSYDFSKPEKEGSIAVGIQISKLNLNKQERHSLLVLAGDKYDPHTDSVTLTGDEADRYSNLIACQEQLNALVKAAKENDFRSIKVDLRHVKPKQYHGFPKQWLESAASVSS